LGLYGPRVHLRGSKKRLMNTHTILTQEPGHASSMKASSGGRRVWQKANERISRRETAYFTPKLLSDKEPGRGLDLAQIGLDCSRLGPTGTELFAQPVYVSRITAPRHGFAQARQQVVATFHLSLARLSAIAVPMPRRRLAPITSARGRELPSEFIVPSCIPVSYDLEPSNAPVHREPPGRSPSASAGTARGRRCGDAYS
jgi:hypothetical protein